MRRSEAQTKSSPPQAGPELDDDAPHDSRDDDLRLEAEYAKAERARLKNEPRVLATPGTRVTVTLGAQKFSPVQYHTFDVGPYSLEVEVRAGESYRDACHRGLAELKAIAEHEFEEALKLFTARVKRGLEEVRRQGLRS